MNQDNLVKRTRTSSWGMVVTIRSWQNVGWFTVSLPHHLILDAGHQLVIKVIEEKQL